MFWLCSKLSLIQRELSLNSGFYPGWKQDSELPFPSVSKYVHDQTEREASSNTASGAPV